MVAMIREKAGRVNPGGRARGVRNLPIPQPGAGIAGALFAVVSLLTFLIDIPALRHFLPAARLFVIVLWATACMSFRRLKAPPKTKIARVIETTRAILYFSPYGDLRVVPGFHTGLRDCRHRGIQSHRVPEPCSSPGEPDHVLDTDSR
jgi:hypothetical protein